MTSAKQILIDRLTQVHRKAEIEKFFSGPWITLYEFAHDKHASFGRYCALASKPALKKVLSEIGWDLMVGAGNPGYVISAGRARYQRFCWKSGIEPFVLSRSFDGVKPSSIEIVEEFRLFHRLYHDQATGNYVKVDEAGDDDIIIRTTKNSVHIRKPAMMEFLAAKQMHLVLYFEFDEKELGEKNPVPVSAHTEDIQTSDRIWSRHMMAFGGEVLSRMTGKITLPPPRRLKASEAWGPKKTYEDYVIGYNETGHSRIYNSNPDNLANNFGANPNAPHYLTPVHFRKDVLTKYYANPERYSVEDGHIRAKGLWSLRLDNDHADRVIVFLGDLGRDLPHKEQVYWKAYNITPDAKLSNTAVRRAFYAEFTSASQPEHVFRQQYKTGSSGNRVGDFRV